MEKTNTADNMITCLNIDVEKSTTYKRQTFVGESYFSSMTECSRLTFFIYQIDSKNWQR